MVPVDEDELWFDLRRASLGTSATGSDPPGRLGYWRFNTPDWRDEEGRLPLIATHVAGVPSFDGNALRAASTNEAGYVRFPCSDATGKPLLNPPQGSIRFLYKPFWASPDTVPRLPAVRPPGHWLRLFEAGAKNSSGYVGRWMLSIDPAGTNLVVHSRDAQGRMGTNLQVQVAWAAAASTTRTPSVAELTQWHEVVLNYTPATCALVIDGAVLQDWLTRRLVGQGLPPFNAASGDEPAFSIGSTLTGEYSAEGLFDELETFDHPLSPLRNYTYLARSGFHASTTTTAPPAVTLSWFTTGNESRSLRRIDLGTQSAVELAANLRGMSYTDTNGLQRGSIYRYHLGTQSLIVGLNLSPHDRRGRVIVLVDRTLASALDPELDRFLSDLAGDGWTVSRHNVPRHDDTAWDVSPLNPAYRSDVARIKSLVAADYRTAPEETAAVLLIGHVTIPYSGTGAEDGHMDHFGAWPADAYYGDLEGDWTDTAAGTPAAVQNRLLRNVPGDGKFDPTTFPKPSRPDTARAMPGMDLAVGRIDFARLPAFRPKSERDLLRQYLTKNHRYRHKQITFQQNALVGGYFGNPYHIESAVLYHTGNLLAYRLYRPVLGTVLDGNAMAGETSAVWAVQGGYGDPTALHNSADMNSGLGIRRVATSDLARASAAPKIGFYVLKGSYFGDWNYTDDNFLRAVLALPDSGLAALWTRYVLWAVDLTGLGDPLAATLLATARGNVSVRNCSLLGDPTLRLFVTAPPGQLTATRTGGSVNLAWGGSPDAAQGYLVYRSANGSNGPFVRVSPSPLAATTYTDPSAPTGALLYQVRACQLIATGCGAFTNTSQGMMAEVRR